MADERGVKIPMQVATGQPVRMSSLEPARVIRGIDGVSPVVTVDDIDGGHRITITDADGAHVFDVMDGETGPQGETGPAGADGAPGQHGYSPTVEVDDITGGHRVTITDANGSHSFDVMDGDSATAPVQDVQVNGTSVLDAQGVANVPEAGFGTYGVVKMGDSLVIEEYVIGTVGMINAAANHRYICGTVSILNINTPSYGIFDVRFTSGSTPTVLTVTPPSGKTMKWANGFNPTNLEADTTYEINIMDGVYGVAAAWT